MTQITVKLVQLPHGHDLPLPEYATAQSAGVDLMAAIDADLVVAPMQRVLVPTGTAIALPAGYEAQIRPRSGLAFKNGITVLNSPGTIDADYRGELKILLVNLSAENFTITRGMRIAQMIVAPVSHVSFALVDTLDETQRNAGGFGSTGVHAKEAVAG